MDLDVYPICKMFFFFVVHSTQILIIIILLQCAESFSVCLSVISIWHLLCCMVTDHDRIVFESLGLRYLRPHIAHTSLHGQPEGEG